MVDLTNISVLRSYTGTDTVSILYGYRVTGDSGGGTFILVPSDTTSADNGGTIIIDGSSRRWYRQTNGDQVNVVWFGAYGDGTHDDTIPIRAAISLGKTTRLPTGTYVAKDAITITTKGQTIFGDGRGSTIVRAPASFNLQAAGIFVFTSGEPAPQLRDFKITCVQPDRSVFNNLVKYPAAIQASLNNGQPRFILTRMAITLFPTCVQMTGNCGGATLNDVQLGGLQWSVVIDGSEDTVRLQTLHVYPFDLTANQSTIFYGTAIGVSSGRCEDLVMTDCLFICHTHLNLLQGSNSIFPGTTFGSAVNCGFDTYTGIVMSAGNFAVNGGYFSLGVSGAIPSIYQTGGQLRLSNVWFDASLTSSFPIVDISPSTAAASYLNITGYEFFTAAADVTCISASGVSGAEAIVQVSSCIFSKVPNTSYGSPVVSFPNSIGRLCMANCQISDKSTGTGTFISINTDNWHRVIGNASTGWSNVFPSARAGIYLYN